MPRKNKVEERENILGRKQENDCNSCRATQNMQTRKKENEDKEEVSKKR